MIEPCTPNDSATILTIVNDAAQAYKNAIPADCWHDPYMSPEHLRREIEQGVAFYGFRENGRLEGVMGIQHPMDVTLIRHAYVRTASRRKGIGGALLSYLVKQTDRPVLVGTWKAATWAIAFYEKHGFRMVDEKTKDRLLKKYWVISERQIETSVVLADEKWWDQKTDIETLFLIASAIIVGAIELPVILALAWFLNPDILLWVGGIAFCIPPGLTVTAIILVFFPLGLLTSIVAKKIIRMIGRKFRH
jgi:GNAT superfamily N-acetyltransferase